MRGYHPPLLAAEIYRQDVSSESALNFLNALRPHLPVSERSDNIEGSWLAPKNKRHPYPCVSDRLKVKTSSCSRHSHVMWHAEYYTV